MAHRDTWRQLKAHSDRGGGFFPPGGGGGGGGGVWGGGRGAGAQAPSTTRARNTNSLGDLAAPATSLQGNL